MHDPYTELRNFLRLLQLMQASRLGCFLVDNLKDAAVQKVRPHWQAERNLRVLSGVLVNMGLGRPASGVRSTRRARPCYYHTGCQTRCLMHPIVLFTFKFEGTAIQVAGADLDAGDAQRLRFFEGRGRPPAHLPFLGT